MKKKLLKKCGVLCSMFLVFVLCCGFDSSLQRVYDEAGLMNREEAARLEQEAAAVSAELKIDLGIVTTADTEGLTTRQYAEKKYNDGGYGYEKAGQDGKGILLLVDMDHRESFVYWSDAAYNIISDSELDAILDAITGYLSDGAYYSACSRFLELMPQYSDIETGGNISTSGAGPNSPMGSAGGRILHQSAGRILIEILIGIAIAAVITAILASRQKTGKTVDSRAYLHDGNVQVLRCIDAFMNTTVVTHHIETSQNSQNSSGGHNSGGGGGSHGGGGGRGF